jgi:hypothetical protein
MVSFSYSLRNILVNYFNFGKLFIVKVVIGDFYP